MPAPGHVLTATNLALQAFIESLEIDALKDKVFLRKDCQDKPVPLLICAADKAERGRARNWKVTGSFVIKTQPTDAAGKLTPAALQASTDLEFAIFDAIESIVPTDDRPQPLGDAITAAAIAAGVVAANAFSMTDFRLLDVQDGYAEDTLWTFSVDFAATVIV